MAHEKLQPTQEGNMSLIPDVLRWAHEGLRYMEGDSRILQAPQHQIIPIVPYRADTGRGRGLGGLELRWGNKIEPDEQDRSVKSEWDSYLRKLSQITISSVPREKREITKRRGIVTNKKIHEIKLDLEHKPPADMQLDYSYLRTVIRSDQSGNPYVSIEAPGVKRVSGLVDFTDDLEVHPKLDYALDNMEQRDTRILVPHNTDFRLSGRIREGWPTHERNPWLGTVRKSGLVDIRKPYRKPLIPFKRA